MPARIDSISGQGKPRRATAHGQRATPADRKRKLVATVSEGQPREHRNVEGASALFDHRREIVAIVVGARRVAIERAQQQRALTAQDPGVMQLIEHALDPVRMLSDVLDEQNAAFDAGKVTWSE